MTTKSIDQPVISDKATIRLGNIDAAKQALVEVRVSLEKMLETSGTELIRRNS
jgi:hypothetical protein